VSPAVALAEVAGPRPALTAVDALGLGGYQPFHVVRPDLLSRLGRSAEAGPAWDRALELTGNDVERDHLRRRRAGAVP